MSYTYEQMIAKARQLEADGNVEDARRLVQLAQSQRNTSGNLVRQAGTGVNEGLSQTLGLPVDLATKGINYLGDKFESATGVAVPDIERPVGGSEFFADMLVTPEIGGYRPYEPAPAPATGPQRFVRRVGQEVGAGAPLVAAMPAAMARGSGVIGDAGRAAISAFPTTAAVDVASDIGAGAAAATAREVAPDSAIAEIAAQLAGGMATAAGVSRAIPSGAPSMSDLRTRQADAYDIVDETAVMVSPDAGQRLSQSLEDTAARLRLNERSHPQAFSALEEMKKWISEGSLDVMRLEEMRRFMRDTLPVTASQSEKRIAGQLESVIDRYIRDIPAADLVAGSADEAEMVARALREGRDTTQRIKKSELLAGQIDRAERQAGRSGTGGNAMNTIRQRVDYILNNPRLLRGFKPDEIQAMRDIVTGTPSRNALRMISRFSPTTGNLQTTAGLLGGGAAYMTGNPLFLAPPAAGFTAKVAGEALDAAALRELSRLIRSGGQATRRSSIPEIASLLAQATGGQQ
jgi:hypothetical protein